MKSLKNSIWLLLTLASMVGFAHASEPAATTTTTTSSCTQTTKPPILSVSLRQQRDNILQKHTTASPYDYKSGAQPINFRAIEPANNFSGSIVPSLQQTRSFFDSTHDCGYFALYNAISFNDPQTYNQLNRPGFVDFLAKALEAMSNPEPKWLDQLEERELRHIVRTLNLPVAVLTVHNLFFISERLKVVNANDEQELEKIFAEGLNEDSIENKISTQKLLNFLKGTDNRLALVVAIEQRGHWIAVNAERNNGTISFTIGDSMSPCVMVTQITAETKQSIISNLLKPLSPYHIALSNTIANWKNVITRELCGEEVETTVANNASTIEAEKDASPAAKPTQNQTLQVSPTNTLMRFITPSKIEGLTAGLAATYGIGVKMQKILKQKCFFHPQGLAVSIAIISGCCLIPVCTKTFTYINAWRNSNPGNTTANGDEKSQKIDSGTSKQPQTAPAQATIAQPMLTFEISQPVSAAEQASMPLATNNPTELIAQLHANFASSSKEELISLAMFSSLRPEQQRFFLNQRAQQHIAIAANQNSCSAPCVTSSSVKPLTPIFAERLVYDAPSKAQGVLLELGNNIPVRKIFIGVPGVGKTFTARALGVISERKHVCVNTSELTTQWQGSGSTNLATAVQECMESSYPSLIILDEMKPLTGSGHDVSPADRLLSLMDSVAGDPRVAFIATANTLDDVPAAVRSRFRDNIDIVDFQLPNTVVLARALEYHIREQKSRSTKLIINNDCLEDKFLTKIASRFNGFTQRDVEGLVCVVAGQALLKASHQIFRDCTPGSLIKRLKAMQPVTITQQDFIAGVREAKKHGNGWFAYVCQFFNDHPSLVEFVANVAVNSIFHCHNMSVTKQHYKEQTARDDARYKEQNAKDNARYAEANPKDWGSWLWKTGKEATGSIVTTGLGIGAGAGLVAGATAICSIQ